MTMVRVLRYTMLLALLFAAYSIPSWAGTCPSGVPSGITNCKFVAYSIGADSNSGDDESNPWKHTPGMTGGVSGGSDACTANCASFNPGGGTGIILKGGEVWPYTVFPMVWSWGGTGSSTTNGCTGSGCVYLGAGDPSWNKGQVNAINLKRDLGGCTGSVSVSISGGGGSGAAATATLMPAGVTTEPNVKGHIIYTTVTAPGSGYTSAPSVTISGPGCNGIVAVADIQRAIFDYGLNVPYTWDFGAGGGFQYGPFSIGSGSPFIIIDHIEVRNLRNKARSGGVITAMLGNNGANSDNITLTNSYAHNRNTDTPGPGSQEAGDTGIRLNGNFISVHDNFANNGETIIVSNGSNCTVPAGAPCSYSEGGFYGNGGDWYNNYVYAARWTFHMGQTGSSSTINFHNNESWLVINDCCGAHSNAQYFLYTQGTVYNYNNVMHSNVSGSSNQQQTGNGTTQYFFNNVNWDMGGGTPNWGLDNNFGAGSGSGKYLFANNTSLGEISATRVCIDGNGGPAAANLVVTMQNNQCITSAMPAWSGSGGTWQNQSGSTVMANVQAANTVHNIGTATAQGYAKRNAFAPTATSNDTVAFANGGNTANLSSLCTGVLVALCSDINGNPRPTSGGWQAGAYQFGSGSTVQVAPPSGLAATVLP